MKILLIILCSFLWIFPAFSVNIYEVIDKKLDIMQESLISQDKNIGEVISTIEKLIKISKRYENKYPEYREVFKYITQDFELFLSEYKQSIGYINIFTLMKESGEISDLTIFQREFSYEGKSYFTMRKFIQNNREKYLVLQDKTYDTFVLGVSDLQDIAVYGKLYESSEYKKHQDEIYNYNPNINSPLQNNGMTHVEGGEEVFLTADFCPSGKHGFEKEILEQFMQQGHKNVGIAITSTWIEGHSDDYSWLRAKHDSGKLNISWINHTKTHNYDYGVDFSQNFILTPGLKLGDEILNVENKLLEKGQIPSIFLRYPGLVSDDQTRKQTIYNYGLLPLGSNAWLAKGEIPEPGSIILIHGNKNEHYGIELMSKVLEENKFEYGRVEDILQ